MVLTSFPHIFLHLGKSFLSSPAVQLPAVQSPPAVLSPAAEASGAARPARALPGCAPARGPRPLKPTHLASPAAVRPLLHSLPRRRPPGSPPGVSPSITHRTRRREGRRRDGRRPKSRALRSSLLLPLRHAGPPAAAAAPRTHSKLAPAHLNLAPARISARARYADSAQRARYPWRPRASRRYRACGATSRG